MTPVVENGRIATRGGSDKPRPSSRRSLWRATPVIRIIAKAMKAGRRRDGFTLIEVLAALAISSVIIVATAALIHNVAGNFDRGTRGVNAADRLMLAMERLALDFSSARYVAWMTPTGPALAFKGEQADDERPAQIVFISSASDLSGPPTDEVIKLMIERSDEVTRLVRRRAAWTGPNMLVDHVSPQDPVVLIEGNLDISFVFGRIAPGSGLVWSGAWTGETTLPRFVRLVLRDRATGSDPIGEADFVVRADAPLACGAPNVGTQCLLHLLPTGRRRTELERFSG
jgi:prepilin-type N-terminal cleavage/methylation domain-containing protein